MPINELSFSVVKTTFRKAPADFEAGFAAIRSELNVPPAFPAAVLEAAQGAQPSDVRRIDAREVPFVAIDPPGATDLDQAFAAERQPKGYRVRYAIADVGAFVAPGGPIDQEARARGTTLYSPDLRTPLHPPVLSEDRASLLPGSERPALVWTLDLDPEGMPTAARLERATVRIREAISYREAQRRIDEGDEALGLLKTIGQLRQDREAARGGISLNLPSQEIVAHGEKGTNATGRAYGLAYDESIPVEGWNAQISLLAGIVAGEAMVDAGFGILRVLPPTHSQDLRRLRRQAKALDIEWPEDVEYPTLIRSTLPDTPEKNAFLLQAARSFRGAGYLGFDREAPANSKTKSTLPDHHQHGAIAATYAHVTAPLRRLVDRFGNELLLSVYADEAPPSWALEALEDLPSQMAKARSRESALERAQVDFMEAMLLQPMIGRSFEAFVVDLDKRKERAVIQIREPAIVARISSPGLDLADALSIKLVEADPTRRSISFDVSDR